VEFEWGSASSEAAFCRRGFDFAFASRIFSGHWIETIDARLDYGEMRGTAASQVETDVVV
jgi:uncharacterized protein